MNSVNGQCVYLIDDGLPLQVNILFGELTVAEHVIVKVKERLELGHIEQIEFNTNTMWRFKELVSPSEIESLFMQKLIIAGFVGALLVIIVSYGLD
jgi:hypothetical protein